MNSEKVRSNKQLRRTRTEKTPGSVKLENCRFRRKEPNDRVKLQISVFSTTRIEIKNREFVVQEIRDLEKIT